MPYIVKYCKGVALPGVGGHQDLEEHEDVWALEPEKGYTKRREEAFVFDDLHTADVTAQRRGPRTSQLIELLGPVEGLATGGVERVVKIYRGEP